MSVTGYGGLSQIDSVAYEGHGSIYGGDQGQSCVAGGDCRYTGFSQADGQSYLGNIGSRGAVIFLISGILAFHSLQQGEGISLSILVGILAFFIVTTTVGLLLCLNKQRKLEKKRRRREIS